MRSQRILALTFAVLVAGCTAGGGSGVPVTASTSQRQVVVGETLYAVGHRPTVPELAGTTLAGKTLAIHDFLGQVVVLNAWASWCDPCRQESPDLARVAKAMAGVGVKFVGLDEQDATSHAIAFVKQVGATYPHLVDGDGRLLNQLGIVPPAAIPSTLVFDRSGHVAARFIGATTAAKLTEVLRQILAEK
jgi:thiol-disulfide isomerase/thioredoxin